MEFAAASDAYIEYGPSGQINKYTTSTQTNVTIANFTIPNGEGDFSAGGLVYYRVCARDTGVGDYGTGPDHSFRLARPITDTGPFSFYMAADPRNDLTTTTANFKTAWQAMCAAKNDFVFVAGDT